MMPSNCEREIRVFMVQEKAQVEGGYDYSEEDPGHVPNISRLSTSATATTQTLSDVADMWTPMTPDQRTGQNADTLRNVGLERRKF